MNAVLFNIEWEMEQRKIMALGKSSLVITLPKYWLEMNNLSQGDHVSLIVQHDLSLAVQPSSRAVEDGGEIHLNFRSDESEDSITRRIIGSYLNGYSNIKLTSEKIFTVKQQRAIRSVVSMLFMRIMESDASSIVLQTLIDESRASVFSSIERMHVITSSMCRDTLIAMREWDGDLANSVVSLEDDVDQFMFFLLRLVRAAALRPSLANQLRLDPLDCLDSQTLVHRIEAVADHTTIIANNVISLIERHVVVPGALMGTLTKAAEIAFGAYDMAVQSFLSKDVSHSNKIIDNQKEIDELRKRILSFQILSEYEDISVVYSLNSIRDSIEKIGDLAADIAELTIDRTYKASSNHFSGYENLEEKAVSRKPSRSPQ